MEEVYAGPFSSTNDTWTRWAESFGTQLVQSTVGIAFPIASLFNSQTKLCGERAAWLAGNNDGRVEDWPTGILSI